LVLDNARDYVITIGGIKRAHVVEAAYTAKNVAGVVDVEVANNSPGASDYVTTSKSISDASI
jgi:hypothetical protein